METAKKVHESLKEGAKDYDVCICWNDWGVLRMDDIDMRYFVRNFSKKFNVSNSNFSHGFSFR